MVEPMSELIKESFWRRIDETRKVSIEVLGRETGINYHSLYTWRNSHYLPSLEYILAIADYLNVTLDWLILGRVCQVDDYDVNDVMKAYIESESVTKLLVKRALKII